MVEAQAIAEEMASGLAEALAKDEVVRQGFDQIDFPETALPLAAHGLLASDKVLASLSTVYMEKFPRIVNFLEQWGDEDDETETHFSATIGKAIVRAQQLGELQLRRVPLASAALVQGKVKMLAAVQDHLEAFDGTWRPWLGKAAEAIRTALRTLSTSIAEMDRMQEELTHSDGTTTSTPILEGSQVAHTGDAGCAGGKRGDQEQLQQSAKRPRHGGSHSRV